MHLDKDKLQGILKQSINQLSDVADWSYRITEDAGLEPKAEKEYMLEIFLGDSMFEVDELKKVKENLLNAGFPIEYLLVAAPYESEDGQRYALCLHGPIIYHSKTSAIFKFLDEIKAEEMKHIDGVKRVMEHFKCSYGAANSAVYLYRKDRGLIRR